MTRDEASRGRRPGRWCAAIRAGGAVERSLKDVDRLLAGNPGVPAHDRVMAQLEVAKVAALLQLADAIRDARRAEGP